MIIFILPPLAGAGVAGGVGPAGAGAGASPPGIGAGAGSGLGGAAGAGGVWVGGVSVVGFISLPQLYDYILARNPKAYKSGVIILWMDQVIIFCAKYLFLAVPAIFVVVWLRAKKHQRLEQSLAIVLAVIFAGIMDKIAGKLFYDPRPFVSQNVTPLISHSADNGFPSEHTLFCFTFATLIFIYNRNLGAVALVISAIVGISRFAAHVHSPIDILAGAIIGTLAGLCGYFAAKKLAQRHDVTKSKID